MKVDASATRAAEIIRKLADRAGPPGMATNKEDQARLGFETERSNYQVNYSFIYPSAAEQKSKKFQKNIGWARYPRVEEDEPSKPPLGGINIGVGSYTKNPTSRSRRRAASLSPTTRSWPRRRAGCRRPPSPHTTTRR